MKLSGWIRLWIVASVIWWIVGVVLLVPYMPHAPETFEGCGYAVDATPAEREGPCYPFVVSPMPGPTWLGFGIVASGWLLLPVSVWLAGGVVRRVLRAFRNGRTALKNPN